MVPKISGVVNNNLPPAMGLQDFESMGCNSEFSQTRPAYIANALLSWVRGRHTFRFGGEYRNQQVNTTEYGNESGSFSFNRLNTGLPGVNSGNSVASFLLGAVSSGSLDIRTQGSQYARQPYTAVYFGDTWKATTKLSIDYGLRWDLSSPITEKHDVLSFFDPVGTNPGAGNRAGRLAFAGDKWGAASLGRRTPESTFYKAFAPRLGFAYTVAPKTVVRAGYGIFFQQLYYTGWTGGVGGGLDGFNANPVFSSTDGGITPAFLLQNGFPQNYQRPPFIDAGFRNGQSIGLYRGFEHGRPPYAQQWNLTIERELSKDLYVTAGYVANKGTRLISAVAAVNAISPQFLSLGSKLNDQFTAGQTTLDGVSVPYAGWVSQMTACPPSVAQALLPYPQFCNSFISNNENAGSSTFHSFQLKAEKRYSNGLWILGSYTLSKLLANTDDVMRIDGGSSGVFSPFQRERFKSLSSGDVPHSVRATAIYQLPFGKGKRFMGSSAIADKILGGWELTSIYTYTSGIPYFFRSSVCNVPAQFRAGCVPAILPGADPFAQSQDGSYDPGKGPLFNAAAFESPSSFNYYFGSGSRTENVRGFAYKGHDVSLLKNIRISEKATFQLRGEFFNVWNWHYFVTGGVWGVTRPFVDDVASPAFGQWNGAVSQPRNIQVGAKIIF